MKPTLPSNEISNRRDSQAIRLTGSSWSKTDYRFKPNGPTDFGRCHGSPAPSFRRISEDYFKHEAPSHFISEAAIFGLMIVTAAVPIIQGVRGALDYLRVVGLL